jgi:hypothetical protein
MIPLTFLLLAGGCSMTQRTGSMSGQSTRLVAPSIVLPAPATGNLLTCGTADPNTDKPTDKSPADTVRIKSNAVRHVAAALCSVGPAVVGVKPVKTPVQ